MLPPLPPWLMPRYVLTGLKLTLTALVLLLAVVGCTTQTVRLEGFQIRIPLIGSIGPQGWKPYAQELEGAVVKVKLERDQANANHAATKQAYRDAQEEAARMEAERIARVIEQQEQITDEVRQDYSRDIAALRARADRLRREARTSAGSATSGLQVPAESDTASGTDAAPDCQRLPAASLNDDLRCREIATAQATQLEALIDWVSRQFGAPE